MQSAKLRKAFEKISREIKGVRHPTTSASINYGCPGIDRLKKGC
jgi:hypothetical protein